MYSLYSSVNLLSKDHIAKTTRSCRFALNNIRKIRPFLTQHAAQLLDQALVIPRLDYCNALLAWLPSCTIKPLWRHYWSTANPKGPMSHLSLSPCTGSRLQLASSSIHWCLHIEQPQAQHPPTSTHLWQSTSLQEVWDLRESDASWCSTFSFTVPGWWNELPTPIRNAESLTIFKRHLKTHLFHHHLTSSKKKIILIKTFALFP